MTERIFISYRRDDSAGHAGRVFDRLRQDFKDSVLFMDVDAIPLGANFVKVLREEVARCSVLLAIIGPGWLEAMDEDGARRLDNPDDFVRVEIAAALARDIPVIPILLEGARIPKATTLPADLQELSQRNGLDVRHASFHGDMDKLVRGLRARAEKSPAIFAAPPPSARAIGSTLHSPALSIAQSETKLGQFIRRKREPIPSVDEVIAARGKWIQALKIDLQSATRPEEFIHYFMQVRDVRMHVEDTTGPGTIVQGSGWQQGKIMHRFLVVHGHSGQYALTYIAADWLAYLGPAWRPEFAQLSEAVFKKLGGVPLARFIQHP